jgi:hypothetical protein
MPQQKLNLLQFPALRAAELRRRPPQIVRRLGLVERLVTDAEGTWAAT